MKPENRPWRIAALICILSCVVCALLVGYRTAAPIAVRNVFNNYLETGVWKSEFSRPELVRHEYILIDGDNIPEMVLIEGDGHADQVHIYRFSKVSQTVECLGAVSINGSVQYAPKGNVIISQYGGTGYYYYVCSSIEDSGLCDYATFLIDATSDDISYFSSFPLSLAERPDLLREKYSVTEIEYNDLFDKSVGDQSLSTIEYSGLAN